MKKDTLKPVYDDVRDRWKLDVPAGLSDTGKRFRVYFKTRDDARDFAAKMQPGITIDPVLAVDADKASTILAKWNLDLTQAARELSAALEELGDSGSLLDAARAYRASHAARTSSKPLGTAIGEYMESRSDLRDATLKSYKYSLESTLVTLHDRVLADISTADIQGILNTRKPTARAMHQRNIKVFWKWASVPPRQWCDMAAVEALESPRGSSDKDIVILTPEAVKALLLAAEAEGHAPAVSYAIAIFGGVRMTELSKLTWADIHQDHIEIGRAIAKKHARRLVPICPTLSSWIDAHRNEATDEMLITPANWSEISKSVRRRAGWKVEARILDNPPKPTRGPWPANAPRHTCASVQVAIGTPLDALIFSFGHSQGHDLLRRHYVSRLTKKDALEILAIGPNKSKVKLLESA